MIVPVEGSNMERVIQEEIHRLLNVSNHIVSRYEFANVKLPVLADTAFTDCRFVGADFSAIDIRNVLFENCDFANCEFSGSYVYNTDFFNCFIEDSRFISAYLENTQFIESDLIGNSFARGVWKDVAFEDSYFNSNGLVDLQFPTEVRGIDLEGFTLSTGDYIVYNREKDFVYHHLIAGNRLTVVVELDRPSRIISDYRRNVIRDFLLKIRR